MWRGECGVGWGSERARFPCGISRPKCSARGTAADATDATDARDGAYGMGRGGLNTTTDHFGLGIDTSNPKYLADEAKLLASETEWCQSYGADDGSGHVDEWDDLLLSMGDANELLSQPLDDHTAAESFSHFNRSVSAPNLLGMPGAAPPHPISLPEPSNSQPLQTDGVSFCRRCASGSAFASSHA